LRFVFLFILYSIAYLSMLKRLYFRLFLLLLAILISFSCPIKQEIKSLLNIPVQSSSHTENHNMSRTCLALLTDRKDIGKYRQVGKQTKFFCRHAILSLSVSLVSNRLLIRPFNSYHDKGIPVFLLFRKLII